MAGPTSSSSSTSTTGTCKAGNSAIAGMQLGLLLNLGGMSFCTGIPTDSPGRLISTGSITPNYPTPSPTTPSTLPDQKGGPELTAFLQLPKNEGLSCEGGEVMTSLTISLYMQTSVTFSATCKVARGMGQCAQKQLETMDFTNVSQLSYRELQCPSSLSNRNSAIQGIMASSSPNGGWVKFTLMCCELEGVPMTAQRTGTWARLQSNVVPQGMYCPKPNLGDDSSGRPQYVLKYGFGPPVASRGGGDWSCYENKSSEANTWCKTAGIVDNVQYAYQGNATSLCGSNCACCQRQLKILKYFPATGQWCFALNSTKSNASTRNLTCLQGEQKGDNDAATPVDMFGGGLSVTSMQLFSGNYLVTPSSPPLSKLQKIALAMDNPKVLGKLARALKGSWKKMLTAGPPVAKMAPRYQVQDAPWANNQGYTSTASTDFRVVGGQSLEKNCGGTADNLAAGPCQSFFDSSGYYAKDGTGKYINSAHIAGMLSIEHTNDMTSRYLTMAGTLCETIQSLAESTEQLIAKAIPNPSVWAVGAGTEAPLSPVAGEAETTADDGVQVDDQTEATRDEAKEEKKEAKEENEDGKEE